MSKPKRSKKRGAPSVAAENAARARENIERKLRAIQLAVDERAKDIDSLAKLPKTPRQFNLWTARKGEICLNIPEADVRRHSNETLNHHPDLKSQAVDAMRRAVALLSGSTSNSRESRLRRLEERLAISERIRGILDKGTKAAVQRLEAANAARVKAEAAKHATEEKARMRIEQLSLELENERKKVSDLTKLLHKTVRLGRAK